MMNPIPTSSVATTVPEYNSNSNTIIDTNSNNTTLNSGGSNHSHTNLHHHHSSSSTYVEGRSAVNTNSTASATHIGTNVVSTDSKNATPPLMLPPSTAAATPSSDHKGPKPNSIPIVDEQIVDPNVEDVLCGRGGMSNHHPGNEWYRRLIRSNRNLYRACPKHTKLLVAKAIVQAVQEQNGRFLERNIQTGMWYTIPYKRAVDKTSQGLREKDREHDGPGGGGGGSSSHSGKSKKSKPQLDMKSYLHFPKDQENGDNDGDNVDDDDDDDEHEHEDDPDKVTNVPYAFSGQGGSSQPHNLSELAQVAVQNTNRRSNTNNKKKNQNITSNTGSSSSAQQFFGNKNHDSNTNNNNTAAAASSKQPPPPLLKSAMKKQSIHTAATTNHPNHSNTATGGAIVNAGQSVPPATSTNSNNNNVEPLTPAAYAYWLQQQQQLQQLQQQQVNDQPPSSVQQAQLLRDISMYRLLKHTQLLPSQTSMLLQMNQSGSMSNAAMMDNNNNNMMGFTTNTGNISQQFHPPPQDLAATVMMMNQSNHNNNNTGNMNMNNGMMNPMLQNGTGGTSSSGPLQQPPIYQNSTNSNNNNNNNNNISSANTNTGGGTLPAGLTRLTSQVSDWLNFFWPTNNNSNSNNNNNNINMQNTMNGMHAANNNNNSINNNIGTGGNAQYPNNIHMNTHPTATMYERQVSAEAAILAAASNPVSSTTSGTMTDRTGTNGMPAPVELYHQQSQQSHHLSATSQQQQQQQQSDVTIESLLQLHRQLSNEIDSTPFTSLFRTNSVLSQQTSLPFCLPTTSNEQQQRLQQSNSRNDNSNNTDSSQALNVSNSSKRPYQERDDETYASSQQQHYRSYRIPIPPEDDDYRQSKQQKVSHLWNSSDAARVVVDEIDEDTKQPGRAFLTDGNNQRINHSSVIGNISGAPTQSAMPSELEQSVSLTLLKLAESPSKLFSGLSSFFGTNPSTALVTNNNDRNQYPHGSSTMHLGQQQYAMYESTLIPQSQQQQQVHAPTMAADPFALPVRPPLPTANADAVATAVENAAGQQRKSQKSLLDDVEETPMEQRMRSLHQYA